MTRFARAKGSKASNERREEEATPWHVMRQQLAEKLRSSQVQNNEDTSYNLKEILNKKNSASKEEIWSDFGETKISPKNIPDSKGRKIHSKKDDNLSTKSKDNQSMHALSAEYDSKNLNKKNSGKLKKCLPNAIDTTFNSVEVEDSYLIGNKLQKSNGSLKKRKVETVDVEFKVTPSRKKIKTDNKSKFPAKILGSGNKNKSDKSPAKNTFVETSVESKYNDVDMNDQPKNSIRSLEKVSTENPQTAKKKKKKAKNSKVSPSVNNDNSPSVTVKKTLSSPNQKQFSEKNGNTSNHFMKNNAYNNWENYGASENRYWNNNYQTVIANGREIHIVRYQGFFVKKDDAEELKKLRKKLLAQSIPKDKLENIMKLERRKAEKALAREKKKVCYHCRQFGHNFSDCPDIKESDMVKTGVCFKCGSLEHSHFECKVQQHQEFRHAVCFVCKEQGHIARQCPLNSQGLYPKGGSCHLCGEVTHLRKDCPKAVEEKSTKSVTVDTLASGTLEDIQSQPLQRRDTKVEKKKVIEFK